MHSILTRYRKIVSLPDVDRSCLNGCLLFLVVENGVIGAFGRSRFR